MTVLQYRTVMIGVASAVWLAGCAYAEAAEPVLRYVSLSRDQAYLREGPTYNHRILWIYKRKGLPVAIIAQYDTWRRIRDAQGTVGWMHSSMLTDARTVEVTGKEKAPVHDSSSLSSGVIAMAEPGVIAKVKSCLADICKIETAGLKGWIEKSRIWGVRPGETF